jgi:hypothetical protein
VIVAIRRIVLQIFYTILLLLMYYSNYTSLFASCMIALGCLYVDVLSSIDGEQFVGDQEQYFEEQNQQKLYFDQGKYNIGFSCCPIHFNHIKSYCMCLS